MVMLRVNTISLSHGFEMRQDYIGTNYWCQKYLPSKQSEQGRYALPSIMCAEIIAL